MMKRILSIFVLLLVVSMGAWATEGDVIYSNDFSTKDQTDFATWLGTGKKPTGFSYAQLGRVGSFSIESGALVHTPTAGKSKSNVNNGEFGTFTEAITTATGSTNYVLSFDVTLTYVSHLASSTIFEISDESKKTVICLYATHTRSNSTTGATSYGYIVGGDNAFVMAEAAGKSTNAEGYFGSGTKHEIANVSETTGSKTYHVILDAQTNGLAKLTIKEGDNAVVDGVDINISSSTGLKYMYLSDFNSYESAVSTITIDNLSIVEGAASTASTADYTVKYVANIGGGETEIKDQVVRTGIVDATVSLSDDDKKVIWYNDKKYIYSSDNASTSTIAEDNSTVVTLTFREAATYNYSLLSSLGETLVSASGFEGETVKVGYPHYQLKDGVLYEAGVTDKEYRKSITLSADNVSETVTYSAKEGVENVVFYAEGEDIEGMTVSTSGNIPVRASQAKAGVASEDVAITTLPAGKYIFHVGAFTSNNSEQKIYVGYGETQYAFASSSNLNETASEEITLTEETAIKYFGTTSSGNAQLDYIFIEKTGEYVPVVSSYTVTIAEGIEGGTVAADPTSANAGAEVTLTNTPAEGYEFVSYSVTCKTNNEAVIVTDGKFTMPADDVTVSATFQLPAPVVYKVKIAEGIVGATVTTNPAEAKAGEEVTISVTPTAPFGAEVTGVSVTGVNKDVAVTVTDNKFTMPDDDVTVNVTLSYSQGPTVYLMDIETNKFYSRGQTWGTQGVIDDYGYPVNITVASGGYEIRMYDWANAGLGENLYTDNGTPVKWEVAKTEDDFYTFKSGDNYLSVGENNLLAFSTTARKWAFLTKDEYEAYLVNEASTQLKAAMTQAGVSSLDDVAPKDVTDKVKSAALAGSIDGWTKTMGNRSDNFSTNEYATESFQAQGSLTQTVEGLAKGLYKVTIQGFNRAGSNADVVARTNAGYNLSTAKIVANGYEARINSWGVDRVSDTNPNSMSEASAAFAQGKYVTEVYTAVGEDGKLDLSIIWPSHIGNNWFICKNLTLTYYTDEVSPEDVEELLKSVPEGKMNNDVQTELNTAKTNLETAATTANYNALKNAIDAANTSIENYEEAKVAIDAADKLDEVGKALYNSNEKVLEIKAAYEAGTLVEVADEDLALMEKAFLTAVKAQTTPDSDMSILMETASYTCPQGNGPGKYQDIYTETYSTSPYQAGKVIYQTIEGLTPGAIYEVKFLAVPNVAWIEAATGDGIAQAYANDATYDITVIAQTGCTPTDYERTLTAVVGEDGVLEFGIQNIAEGGNWYVEKGVGLTFKGISSYTVTIADGIVGGTVAADPTSANAGAEVTLTNTPAEGYEFVSYSVKGVKSNEAVLVTDGKFTMPADDVTVSATFAKVYAVTISNEIENGTVVADPTSAKEGDEVTLTNTPAEGYEFVNYSVTGKTNNEAVIVTDGKFTMPADDVTVSATFQLPTPPSYDITVADGIVGGTVAVNPTTAKAGDEVTITATPAEGYELASISVTGQTSNLAVEVTDGKFTMPADAVTVNAKFQQKAVDPSGDEEIALAADMFYTWDGYGADASKIASATVDFKVGESVDQGATVVGTGSVDYLTYADMTGSTKVIFEGTNGTVIRLLMNRQESNNGPLVEKTATIAEGKAEISLTDLAYVHINAIKIPYNGSTGNIISAITFVKPNDPLAGPKEALKDAIAAAKMQNSVAKTEESFAALTKAISDGEAALADAQATVESLTTAKSDIETAVKGLTLAEGYAEVTKEMFKQYASVDEPGEGTATTGAYELFTASDLPYGDGSVSELKWADLTKYDKLIVTVAGTTAPRLCMNRLVKEGQQAETQEDSKMLDINPNNGNTWSTEKYQTVADGVYTIDLAAIVKDYSFARLHCIKKQGWGAGVVVTGMYLHEAPVTYDITVADGIENGTVTVDPTTAKAGDEVTITATPAEGYELVSITVTGVASEEIVEVTDGKFTMPANDVTVGATFKFAPMDKTDLITNWDFTGCENNNFPGWTIYNPNGGNAWKNGTSNVEYWIGTAANGVFDYYQDIDAPDGVYTLTANMWNSTNGVATDAVNGNAGVYGTSSGVTVFAGVTDDCDNANLHQYTTEPIKVLDGKLRLGVKNNGVMGARWFGVDWIKLTQIGKVQALDYEAGHTEALNAAKATLSAEENAIVVGEERTALEAAIEKNSEVAEQTVEAYKAAIKALQTASNDFTAARAGYAALASTKETLLGYAEKYVYASAEKTAAVTAAAEAAPTSAADATSKNVNLINALRAMAESHAKAEGVEGAEAIAITNPSAEDNTNGWTTVKGEGSDGSIGVLSNEPWTSADGSTAHKYFDGGNWGASAWDVSLTQNVELAAGKYMLSAISRASGDVALTIFAGENKTTMPSIGAAGGIFDRGWNISSVEFEVNANSTVTIGVQGVTSVIHNWMSFSDFKLVLIESYAVKVAKAELLEAINEAKAIDTEGKNGANELAAAITVAEGVYNNDEATVDDVNTAKSDLAAAVAAFDKANKVYAVNVDAEIENGTVAVNPTSAKAGDEVTITATPAEGYELASITVTGVASEEIVEVTDGKFTMPADDVTVTATFVLATGIDAAPTDKSIKADGKYFKNGKLIIIKNGKEYNAAGVAK